MSAILALASLLLSSAPPGAAQGWNPADKGAGVTVSGTGDTIASSTANDDAIRSVTSHGNSGDWYAEMTIGGADGNVLVGIGTSGAAIVVYPGVDSNGLAYYGHTGQKYTSNAGSAYGATFGPGDVIGVRLNAGVLTFYKNGASQGAAFSGLGAGPWFLMWGPGTSGAGTRTCTLNTGQSAFANLPSGAAAWG